MGKININIAKGSLEKPKVVLGIDLGTTNSLSAYVPKGKSSAQVISIRGNETVPSVIHFNENDFPEIGFLAKEKLMNQADRTIYSVKRLLGKSYSELQEKSIKWGYKVIEDQSDNMVKVNIGDKFYNPIELSAEILKELKIQSEKALNADIDQAVITVPAYFNESQRQATRDAGKLAGLDVMRIINEPTAASLAYGIDGKGSGNVLVYDLGGGTFDVSILTIEDGVFEVLSTYGDTYLGGDDIDEAIVDYWMTHELKEKEIDKKPLKWIAEQAKVFLSGNPSEPFEYAHEGIILKLGYQDIVKVAQPILEKTWVSVKRALKDAELKPNEISEVVLVGGSTRFPEIKKALQGLFGNTPINDTINPDKVVALGAAIEADVIAGNRKDVLLLDVTPLSLGIETAGQLMDVLIPRNSKIPCRVEREYTTSVDGQVNLKVSVYQGERELVSENRKLGEFDLKGIPAMPVGLPKIEIQFALNADGMLKVKAIEKRSGTEQAVEIQPSSGLTDDQVEQMLQSGLENAKGDLDERMLRETQNEGEQIIYTTLRFIEKNTNLLTGSEINGAKQRIDTLKGLLKRSTDRHELQSRIEELNDYSRPFAERLMDTAVSTALKGKQIDDE
jgi:molecular chaperone DnaK (HSP70)